MEYCTLAKVLKERFAPANQTKLYRVQLKERRQCSSETLSGLSQTIRWLFNKVYVAAPAEVKHTLSMWHFSDAVIDAENRTNIKQAKSTNLN